MQLGCGASLVVDWLKGTVGTLCTSSRYPIFITVVSVFDLTGPILVADANPGLDSIMWIVRFNASETACIPSATAHVPWCDIQTKYFNHKWSVKLLVNLSGLFSHILNTA